MTEQKHRILFVCMGNICRSPTAEGLLIEKVNAENTEAAAKRGIDLSKLRSRKIKSSDFEYYDLILVMDNLNRENLMRLCPDDYKHKIKLMLDYLPEHSFDEVPDPYYGGERGFEDVLDILEEAIEALYEDIY